jgi:hypothetical protein
VPSALRFRLEDLRRHTVELVGMVGVPPSRAALLASHLLWFDAAGASTLGIATLPRWLERLSAREIDPVAEGRVVTERNGTAVLDGQNGLPPLLLEHAARLAVEKARDAGVGLVQVGSIGPMGPAAAVAADMALGPHAAFFLGPDLACTLALPTAAGLPVIFDRGLAVAAVTAGVGASADRERSPAVPTAALLPPWAALLAPEGGWLVVALSIAAGEPLMAFHRRVETALGDQFAGAGRLVPDVWAAHRRAVLEEGIALPAAVRKDLSGWAHRLALPPLVPTPAPRPALDSDGPAR